jgi:hypothetical protein
LLKKQLHDEFENIDKDHNGLLTVEEVQRYLYKQDVDQNDMNVINSLFAEMDKDNNGTIEPNEFVDYFFEIRQKYEDDIELLEKQLVEDKNDLKQIEEKLVYYQQNEKYTEHVKVI